MDINKLEYEMFELADMDHPGMRLHKIQKDITSSLPPTSTDTFLRAMKDAIIAEFTPEELTVTEEDVINYHVTRLAKMMAVDMLTTGKTSQDTMLQAINLPDDNFDAVIRLTNKMATSLNSRVKENESITNANRITGKL